MNAIVTDIVPAKAKKSAMHGESGYKRLDRDAYFTPAWVPKTFLEAVSLRGEVWEPADGTGAISLACAAAGYTVHRSDVHDYGTGATVEDFLQATGLPSPGVRTIITNPPYGDDAERFALHAVELTHPVDGMVVMVLRNEYDCSVQRSYLFEEMPFAAKVVLTSRPLWTAKKKKSPRHNFSWYVWDWRHEGPATIRWIHRDPVGKRRRSKLAPKLGAVSSISGMGA